MGHRLNGNTGAVIDGITAGKDTGNGSGVGFGIGSDGLPGGVRKLIGIGTQIQRQNLLADGSDNRINGQHLNAAFYRYRTAAATGIRLSQLHLLQLNACYMAVGFNNFGGRNQEFELYALLPGLTDLDILSRHFGLGATVQDINLLGTQTDGGTAGIHGGVAAADYGYAAAQMLNIAHGHVA